MALVGGRLAAAILRRYEWHDVEAPAGYEGGSKIEALFGPGIWDQIADKTVLDFGCGHGREAIEVARHGAKHVIGLDIQEKHLMTRARTRLPLVSRIALSSSNSIRKRTSFFQLIPSSISVTQAKSWRKCRDC